MPSGLCLRRAAIALVLLLGPGPAAAQVGAVPVRPDPPGRPSEAWVAGKASSRACIDVGRIAGAVVVDPRTLDIVMKGGQRWRLTLAQSCQQLSFYGGFYYQPRMPGRFCAGQDRIIGRAGGQCRVRSIAPLARAR